MKVQNLTDVFHDELMDLYSAEQQLTKALPKLARAASSDELRQAFEQHLEQTNEHVRRLEQVAEKVNLGVKGETCEAMEGLIEEGENLIEENEPSRALDAALIAAAQRVEHYEIAAYGAARTHAKHLGHDDAHQLLQKTLDEEGETDHKLTDLAESSLNREALQG